MAENKKSFILYADLIHTVKKMPREKAGDLLVLILEYVNDENPTTDDILLDLVFEPIKQQLKRDLKNWEGIREARSLAGKKGMEKRWKTNDNSVIDVITNDNGVKQNITNITVNDNVNVNDNVIDTVITENPVSEKPKKEISWRTSYQLYLEEARLQYAAILKDEALRNQMAMMFPRNDYNLGIERIFTTWLGTHEGWQYNKKKKCDNINWKATVAKNFNQPWHRVYKEDKK